MRKLAIIRNNDNTPCPFGLTVNYACYTAGNSVDSMQVIEDTNKEIIENNLLIFEQNPEPTKCKYAAHLFANKPNVVDCDFGSAAAGLSQNVSFVGFPHSEVGVPGLLTYPQLERVDDAWRRNPYYGMYGWGSARQIRMILRQSVLEILKNRKS